MWDVASTLLPPHGGAMNRLGMHDLQELVRLHRMGTGCRQVSRLLKISPNTEREYRLALEAAGLLNGSADALPELTELRAAVDAARPSKPPPPQQLSSVGSWTAEVETLLRAGATPTAIYDRHRLEHADFRGSLSAIKRLCLRLKRAEGVAPEDIAIPVETDPGEIAQVDFGDLGKLWDPATGRVRQAYVFVMVLGHSRHQVCRVVFDQKIDTWLQLHVEAFEELGGVPRILVPDNLKAAVIRAAFGVGDSSGCHHTASNQARAKSSSTGTIPSTAPNSSATYCRNAASAVSAKLYAAS